MYRKVNFNALIVNHNGTVIVEFVFVFSIIMIMLKLLISVVEYQSTVGKLDRISYSMAGIVREREQLYANDNLLTPSQINQLKQLADNMLFASGINNRDLLMTVESLHFNPAESSSLGEKVINRTKSQKCASKHYSPTSPSETCSPMEQSEPCSPMQPLENLANLSPYSKRSARWIPLYQVTLCLPAPAWYRSLFSQADTIPMIKSSAITIERSSITDNDQAAHQ